MSTEITVSSVKALNQGVNPALIREDDVKKALAKVEGKQFAPLEPGYWEAEGHGDSIIGVFQGFGQYTNDQGVKLPSVVWASQFGDNFFPLQNSGVQLVGKAVDHVKAGELKQGDVITITYYRDGNGKRGGKSKHYLIGFPEREQEQPEVVEAEVVA
ncbi:MAG: hypothetical protein HRU12_09695 [Phaeodactylibacter sp.]|nr:hypothetical protein [Phaeodactylibacter sp.]